MDYCKSKRDKTIIDPTTDKRYVHAKAKKLGITLVEVNKRNPTNSILPTSNYKNDKDGWTKLIGNLPAISNTEIDTYHEKSSTNVLANSTAIKKMHIRGEQFLKEKYIDSDFVFTKENDSYFFLKALCSASKKQTEYNISLALSKIDKSIAYAYCECPAGSGGVCSHCYALMKLVAKWSIDRLTYVPSETSCTAQPCQWSQRKSVAHLDQKEPLALIPMKRKSCGQGIPHRLYDARVMKSADTARLSNFNENMEKFPISQIFQTSVLPMSKSKFGDVPLGSPLSYQYPILDAQLNVTCSFTITANPSPPIIDYPKFPIHMFRFVPMYEYFKFIDINTILYIENLKVDYATSERIEEDTRNQAASDLWHNIRKERFTASKCNRLKGLKTGGKGLLTFANDLVNPQPPNDFLAKKIEYGRVNEPIALTRYEEYFKGNDHPISVSSCGIIVPSNSYILGASPDGKVIDTLEDDIFGIVEVKCPERYSEFDVADIAKVEKNSI